VNLGYVCINTSLPNTSPNRRITAKRLKRLPKEEGINILNEKLIQNLKATLKILQFNKENNIKMYRFTSNLVPLSTHVLTREWNYIISGKKLFKQIGNFVKKNNMRVSTHPDHFTVLNSNNKNVVKRAKKDLEYHSKMLNAMELPNAKMVLHIGGVYGNKKSAIKRFKKEFDSLSNDIKNRLIIENDDKSYTATEVLNIAKDLQIPMVLDYHHYNCNNTNDEDIKELIPKIFNTWNETPKIHFSSPKSKNKYRAHADYINKKEFSKFIKLIKQYSNKFDVMLESKMKEDSLLKLRKELK
jgi:UV DNA damage endonuclease